MLLYQENQDVKLKKIEKVFGVDPTLLPHVEDNGEYNLADDAYIFFF